MFSDSFWTLLGETLARNCEYNSNAETAGKSNQDFKAEVRLSVCSRLRERRDAKLLAIDWNNLYQPFEETSYAHEKYS